MIFNQFIWNNYKESKNGQEVIKYFEKGDVENIFKIFVQRRNSDFEGYLDFFDNVNEFNKIPEDISIGDIFKLILENGLLLEDSDGEFELFKPNDYNHVISAIEPLSLWLFLLDFNAYLPYFFQKKFLLLSRIADTFGIEMPVVPLRKNKNKRVLYYLEFCKIFHQFRIQNNLSSSELCAFLYDFAPKFIEEKIVEIPEPANIWITAAGVKNGDYDFLLNSNDGDYSSWSGNEDAKVGDIVLIYCLSPKSSIEFIGRCIKDGIRDPFYLYYGVMNIGKFQKIKPIHISEIKSDEYLKELPVVKKNFQGVNGVRLNNEDYKRILYLLEQKHQDITILPKLSSIEFKPNLNCKTERDVEIEIVEPFLHKIGYLENDWIRQLSVRMGRGERNYPDYVFFAEANKGYEKAKMLLETKFTIKSNRELEETFQQAHSYALRLEANRLIICDKDFIWLYIKQDGSFDRTKYLKYNWIEINDPDVFNRLKKLIGKNFIK